MSRPLRAVALVALVGAGSAAQACGESTRTTFVTGSGGGPSPSSGVAGLAGGGRGNAGNTSGGHLVEAGESGSGISGAGAAGGGEGGVPSHGGTTTMSAAGEGGEAGQGGTSGGEPEHPEHPLLVEDFSALNLSDPEGLVGLQCDTKNIVYAWATLPGWRSTGLHAAHGVVWNDSGRDATAPGNLAVQLYAGDSGDDANAIESSSLGANTLGATYVVSFLGGPGVWADCSQATSEDSFLRFEVVASDDTVLDSYIYGPSPWNGLEVLTPDGFTYSGDGSGAVRLRITAGGPTGRFGGAIDDLRIVER